MTPPTTRRWGLSAAEWTTTGAAAAVSTAGYVAGGQPYLARGVLGDLLGFLLLASVGLTLGARVRHEALVCLLLIGVVLAVDPRWPVGTGEPVWWAAFSVGLVAYLAVRRRLCG